MRLLAIETSSRVGSLALFGDGEVIAARTFEHGLQNAAKMLPLLDEMLRAEHLAPGEIGVVAVSQGPGSFTGLRLGITLAKTLCFATGAKLVAVPSLEVIAHNAPAAAAWVMPVLDARRGQVFTALYQRVGDTLVERTAPHLSPLADSLAAAPRPVALLGEGVGLHLPSLLATAADPETARQQRLTPGELTALPEALSIPRAEVVGSLAIKRVQAGQLADPFALTPIYLRKPEAQERMEAGLLKHLQ